MQVHRAEIIFDKLEPGVWVLSHPLPLPLQGSLLTKMEHLHYPLLNAKRVNITYTCRNVNNNNANKETMTQAISFEIVYLQTVVGDGAKNKFGSCCQQLYDLLNHSCFFLCKNGRNDALRRWKVRKGCLSTRL